MSTYIHVYHADIYLFFSHTFLCTYICTSISVMCPGLFVFNMIDLCLSCEEVRVRGFYVDTSRPATRQPRSTESDPFHVGQFQIDPMINNPFRGWFTPASSVVLLAVCSNFNDHKFGTCGWSSTRNSCTSSQCGNFQTCERLNSAPIGPPADQLLTSLTLHRYRLGNKDRSYPEAWSKDRSTSCF